MSASTTPPPSPPPSAPSASMQGVLLIAVLMDMALFGLVTQQFYTYWISGFRDRIYLRLFVIVQYLLVALQNLLMWHLSYNLFIVSSGTSVQASLWAGPANSLVQLFIILLANTALAARIEGLTQSRIQSATVIGLSAVAFVFGMVTVLTSWRDASSSSYTRYTSPIWRAIQAIAECLITFFLVRSLLRSRSGVRASDSVVHYIVRNVIQTGLLATTWAIAALVTWFLLPVVSTYRIFDITSGSVYTQAMFELLLSRKRLREQMLTPTLSDLGVRAELQSQDPERFSVSRRVTKLSPAPFDVSGSESRPGLRLNTMCEVLELRSLRQEKADGSHQIA